MSVLRGDALAFGRVIGSLPHGISSPLDGSERSDAVGIGASADAFRVGKFLRQSTRSERSDAVSINALFGDASAYRTAQWFRSTRNFDTPRQERAKRCGQHRRIR